MWEYPRSIHCPWYIIVRSIWQGCQSYGGGHRVLRAKRTPYDHAKYSVDMDHETLSRAPVLDRPQPQAHDQYPIWVLRTNDGNPPNPLEASGDASQPLLLLTQAQQCRQPASQNHAIVIKTKRARRSCARRHQPPAVWRRKKRSYSRQSSLNGRPHSWGASSAEASLQVNRSPARVTCRMGR